MLGVYSKKKQERSKKKEAKQVSFFNLNYLCVKIEAINMLLPCLLYTSIFGEAAERGAVISFLVGDIHHFDLGTLLDRLGIAVRTGHHCAQPLMQRLGIEGTVRASFAMYNTKSEIDTLVAGIERVSKMF